jgi:alkylation response protein AidB-like acyl-CoA dehydrogenase
LSIAGDDAWAADIPAASISPVPSSFGYPFGTVGEAPTTALPPGSAALIRARWHLALAAEIAGTAQGALHQLTSYLRRREQFGAPLSSFQALRHRVAELAVSAGAAVWLARQAAWHGDAHRAGLAAVYARELAVRMAPELVQLGGARSFSLDFPLHLYAMRLEGLRLMLGSADRLAGEVMDAPQRETVA